MEQAHTAWADEGRRADTATHATIIECSKPSAACLYTRQRNLDSTRSPALIPTPYVVYLAPSPLLSFRPLYTLPTRAPLDPQKVPNLHLINPNLDLALSRMPPLILQTRIHGPPHQRVLVLVGRQLAPRHVDDDAYVSVLVRLLGVHPVAAAPVDDVEDDLGGGPLRGGQSRVEEGVQPFGAADGGGGDVDVEGCVHCGVGGGAGGWVHGGGGGGGGWEVLLGRWGGVYVCLRVCGRVCMYVRM